MLVALFMIEKPFISQIWTHNRKKTTILCAITYEARLVSKTIVHHIYIPIYTTILHERFGHTFVDLGKVLALDLWPQAHADHKNHLRADYMQRNKQ